MQYTTLLAVHFLTVLGLLTERLLPCFLLHVVQEA